ncbi:MAG: NAD(P)/FAD-dependent oxidoreductase [Candidatus Limnocylindrales bacterium]
MSLTPAPDAIVVGSGPNGLAAAITLAREGLSVRVYEAALTAGGGTRSAELTLPGFTHDVCATVAATALISPFIEALDLGRMGVELAHPEIPVAHALDERAVLLHREIDATAEGLGRDGAAYRRLMGPIVSAAGEGRLLPWILGPVARFPRHPLAAARFGLPALASTTVLTKLLYREAPARALHAGLSAHAMLPLRQPATASFGLVLALAAHLVGWPVVRGGMQRFADALVSELRALGGEVVTGHRVDHLSELPPTRAVLLDVTPRAAASITGEQLPARYRRALERFRYGPGVCKVDWALSEPIPWRHPELARAGTVHLGGDLAEIDASERTVHRGRLPERPFVLLVQPTVADPSRAPEGRHIAWAYAHVPHGSDVDLSARMETEIERHAPGFRETVIGRSVRTAREMERYDANYVGGDINGGLQDLRQVLARPVIGRDPYATPVRGLYLCSSSTPPGGGVHGMSGHLAARSALRREFGVERARRS